MNYKYLIVIAITILFFVVACNENPKNEPKETIKKIEVTSLFNKDSAFSYVKAQTDFGPRVPNSKASTDCAKYLINKLEQFCDTVHVQLFQARAFDGTVLRGTNIIGSFNPENPKRILLSSHWDSRPFADHDPDEKNHHTPIDGANDGASGVGVLIEIARLLQTNKPNVGVDIIFFDAEDYGPHKNTQQHNDYFWGLGSQYWAANPHVFGYKAAYGILLDMVGDKKARFYKERLSLYYAPQIVNKIWTTAIRMGYETYFIDDEGGYVTDDHYFINEIAKIPTVDIIHYDPSPESNSGFVPYWHTVEDNIEKIDPNTLEVVGKVVLQVIFEEK